MALMLEIRDCLGDCGSCIMATKGICFLCKKIGLKTKFAKRIYVRGECEARICDDCHEKLQKDL